MKSLTPRESVTVHVTLTSGDTLTQKIQLTPAMIDDEKQKWISMEVAKTVKFILANGEAINVK